MEKPSPFGKWESAWERSPWGGFGGGGWKVGLWGLLVLERFILRQVPTRVGWFPGSKGDFLGDFFGSGS